MTQSTLQIKPKMSACDPMFQELLRNFQNTSKSNENIIHLKKSNVSSPKNNNSKLFPQIDKFKVWKKIEQKVNRSQNFSHTPQQNDGFDWKCKNYFEVSPRL